MPKETKTTSGGVAREKKAAGSSTSWRGLPTKLKDLPNSEQLFSMWGNDSFRQAPPVVPTNTAVWDAKDPSRPLPYSFQTPTPVAPPPIAGVAFVTKPKKTARPRQPAKQSRHRRRLLPALHPTSESCPPGPSSAPATVIAIPMPCYPHLAPPSPPLDYMDDVALYTWPPPAPVQVKKEAVVEELPYESAASGSEQDYGSTRDQFSSEPSLCSASRTGSPSTSVATPPSSPPLRPWSSASGACLSPLMLGERVSAGGPAKSSPAIARARSDPPTTSFQNRSDGAMSVYEVCRQRRLPPMTFKKPAASSSALGLPHKGKGLVLPPLRESFDSHECDSADEGRDFDVSCQRARKARHGPYRVPDVPRGERNLKKSETDLPPLRLLLEQLELDEQRRAHSEPHSQPPSNPAPAAKLPISQRPAPKRGSTAPARRPGVAATKNVAAVAPPVPAPAFVPHYMAPVAPVHFGEFWVDFVPSYRGANPRPAAHVVHPQRGGLHAL